ELQQRLRLAAHVERSGRRRGCLRDEAQQRALAGAIASDDADPLAARNVEADVLEGRVLANAAAAARQQAEHIQQTMPRRRVELVDLRQLARADDDVTRGRRQGS